MKNKIVSLNTVVIGSGAAGLNAAVRLHEFGQTDLAIVTDRFGAGTSANSGSDKQTYYKLSLAGDRARFRRSTWPATWSPAAPCTATSPWPKRRARSRPSSISSRSASPSPTTATAPSSATKPTTTRASGRPRPDR